MNISHASARIAGMPRKFNELGASIYDLLKGTGYFEVHGQITESSIREALLAHPEYVQDWLDFAGDKRTREGWYLRKTATAFEVGYYPSQEAPSEPLKYSEGAAACAAFIKRELEDLRTSRRRV